MKRTLSSVNLGSKTRHKVRIESDQCREPPSLTRLIQNQMIEHLANVPDLLVCGPEPFQKLSMYHDGDKWVIEAEAEVEVT